MSTSFCSSSLKEAGHHIFEVELDFFDVRSGNNLQRRKRFLPNFDFDQTIVEAALAQLLAQPLARALRLFTHLRGVLVGRKRPGRQQQIEQALLRILLRLDANFDDLLVADHRYRNLDEIADHRFHVAADVANLSEFRGFDLQERRLRHLR